MFTRFFATADYPFPVELLRRENIRVRREEEAFCGGSCIRTTRSRSRVGARTGASDYINSCLSPMVLDHRKMKLNRYQLYKEKTSVNFTERVKYELYT